MKFTYHKNVPKPDDVQSTWYWEMLSEELKSFLTDKNQVQDRYFFEDNGYYVFIYLSNGDRVDIAI
jgi:hypothetical protein